MSRLIVTDTTALIALDRIGRLDLLPALYAPILAPTAVAEEYGRALAWLHTERVEDRPAVERLLPHLDLGEAEAIVLAQTRPGATLLMDESRGRKVALGRGMTVIGTAGVLLLGKRAGLLEEVRPLLDRLIAEHRFHLAKSVYHQGERILSAGVILSLRRISTRTLRFLGTGPDGSKRRR